MQVLTRKTRAMITDASLKSGWVLMDRMILKLYISGMSAHSDKIIADIKSYLNIYFKDQFDLYIIDIKKNPDLAKQDNILATPILCRVSPLPEKRFIGDLAAQNNLLNVLGAPPDEMVD